jgi:hypothetical protein
VPGGKSHKISRWHKWYYSIQNNYGVDINTIRSGNYEKLASYRLNAYGLILSQRQTTSMSYSTKISGLKLCTAVGFRWVNPLEPELASIGERYVQWTQNIYQNIKISIVELRNSKRSREDGKDKGEQDGKESEHEKCNWKKKSLLIWTQSVAFWYTDFCTTLYFVNQRNS